MRWDRLFSDLEAQIEEAERAERDAELVDRAEREVGRQQLTDRLRASTGTPITARISGVGLVRGVVRSAGAGWMLVGERGDSETLVALRAVLGVTGLGTRAVIPGSEGAVMARLGLAYALRELAREGAEVVVVLTDGTMVAGVLDRVGADFVDVIDESGAATAIPFEALAVVRPRPSTFP
jgi:hypothetical protein